MSRFNGRHIRNLRPLPLSVVIGAVLSCCVISDISSAQDRVISPTNAPAASNFARVDHRIRMSEGPGAVDRIEVSAEDGAQADGHSLVPIEIKVFGPDGQPATGVMSVTIETSAGTLRQGQTAVNGEGLDTDPVTPGAQIALVNGVARVSLQAPFDAQTVKVRVIAGDEITEGELHFVPELRDMIAFGVIDGVVALDRKSPFSFGQARPNDGFEDRINSWSRLSSDGKRSAALRSAFFLKGRVGAEGLLTMSYDSDKPSRDRLFRDLDPERFYPTYGDSSLVGFDARSNSRLYLRYDVGRNYLMYGDITTGDGFSQRFGQGSVASTAVRDLGQYSRAMTGVRGHLENDRGYMDVFGAYDNLRQVVEEFPGRGLSGPYTVSNSLHAIIGSERVELVVRDRYAPSRIVTIRPLQRFADYTFEPFSGRILMTTPVPSVDSELNPVSVRITYEIEQGGDRFWVYGANAQYQITPSFNIGGSAVKDENPLAPFSLYSANATVNLGPNTYLRGEWAKTESTAGSWGGNIYTMNPALNGEQVNGDAWRVEFKHHSQRNDVFAYYGEADRDFNNPSSSFLGGRKQGGLSFLTWLGPVDAEWHKWAVYGFGSYVKDTVTNAERSQAAAGVRYAPSERFSLDIGANHINEQAGTMLGSNGTVLPGSLNAPFGIGTVTPGFGGGFFSGSQNAILPTTGQTLFNTGSSWSTRYGSWVGNGLAGVPVNYTALRLAMTYRPNAKLDLNAEVEQDINHSDHRRAALGFGYRVHDKTRLYGQYEWNTGLSTVATSSTVTNPITGRPMPSPYDSNAFVFGLETEYMEGGTAFNEYRMYDSFGVRQAQNASGLRNLWHINKALTLQTGLEHLQVLDGSGQKSTAATIAAEYRPNDQWFANGRLEWRRTDPINNDIGLPAAASWMSDGYDSWLSTMTFATKLNRDWSFIARNYYLLNDYRGARRDSYEDRFQVGFAYRDTDRNRFNLLTRYEYWTRRDSIQKDWLPANLPYTLSDGYDKHIFSLHADYHPNRVWWLSGRVAAKQQTDLFGDVKDKFTAYLVGGRVTYQLSERWDVSGMGYTMWSPDKGGTRQHAVGAEVGYMLTSNLWLSAGYNARGFNADDMIGAEYTNQGTFIRLRFKFDENIFQGRNPAINRSLPR